MLATRLSKGEEKRRRAAQVRRMDRLNKLRHHPLWSEPLTRLHFEEFEDLALEHSDDELANVVLRLVDECKALVRNKDAERRLQKRLDMLSSF